MKKNISILIKLKILQGREERAVKSRLYENTEVRYNIVNRGDGLETH